jgi:tetratricopeptide (TPR) repeat protein
LQVIRFTLLGFCLIVFGFTQAIRAQDQLPSQSKEELSDVKILLPGSPVAIPTSTNQPAAEPSLYLKGLSFLETGQNAEAVEVLRQAVEHDPNDAAAYGKLGVAYATLGQYKEAVLVLKIAIRIKPEIVDAQDYYHLSRSYAGLEKFPLALEAIKVALYTKRAEQVNKVSGFTSAPSMADIHYSAGLAYYNLQRYRDATKELKQVIALNPKHAPGYFGLALTYLATGDRKAAEKQQEALESLDPVYAAKIAKLLAIKSDTPQGLVFTFKADP